MTYVFNPKQIPSITNTVSVIDSNGNSLVNDFIRNTGDIMKGDLVLQGNGTKIIFSDGSSQNVAFDEGRIEQINHIFDLTSDMSKNNNGTLVIGGDVEIVSNLSVPDNSFTISKVYNLQNNLNSINSSLATN